MCACVLVLLVVPNGDAPGRLVTLVEDPLMGGLRMHTLCPSRAVGGVKGASGLARRARRASPISLFSVLDVVGMSFTKLKLRRQAKPAQHRLIEQFRTKL
eukprot:84598-Amphidinium_carterae.1